MTTISNNYSDQLMLAMLISKHPSVVVVHLLISVK